MSISTVKTALLGKLNAMGSLKVTYGRETGNPSGNYPYATLTLRDGDGEFATTKHNYQRYGFWIRVYQEQSKQGQGVQGAEDISVIVMDELRIALNMDTTLSGNCKYVRPISFDASYVNRDLDMRVLEIKVDAHDVVSAA